MKFSFSSIINMGNFDQLWNQLEAFRQIETRYVLRNKLIKYTFSLKKENVEKWIFFKLFFFSPTVMSILFTRRTMQLNLSLMNSMAEALKLMLILTFGITSMPGLLLLQTTL